MLYHAWPAKWLESTFASIDAFELEHDWYNLADIALLSTVMLALLLHSFSFRD
jgi:hypothetical protein